MLVARRSDEITTAPIGTAERTPARLYRERHRSGASQESWLCRSTIVGRLRPTTWPSSLPWRLFFLDLRRRGSHPPRSNTSSRHRSLRRRMVEPCGGPNELTGERPTPGLTLGAAAPSRGSPLIQARMSRSPSSWTTEDARGGIFPASRVAIRRTIIDRSGSPGMTMRASRMPKAPWPGRLPMMPVSSRPSVATS